ncbi:hypothetical protein P171DRAFT_439092 [Karstenula rhodostoma CBS 690.94]|uniref:Uncharacterized protein n=1 Tax=Karstenula rhodostoma CBS 690.94 TaxID=1392251 RepID=A0A9P4PSC6_9PLEO|nr:hypothetical protein P171DRAFT_439092 [Karstenula rhodostoma CBS 690.94]
MSHHFLFYTSPDSYSMSPPHPDVPAPNPRPLQNVYFDTSVPNLQSHHQRTSVCNGIMWLPLGSLVAAFASGNIKHPSTPDLVPFVHIFKYWHQWPNQHCSMTLGWTDKHGNNPVTFGNAHVHRNGLEMVYLGTREQGGTMVRPYGRAEYDWYPPPGLATAAQHAAPTTSTSVNSTLQGSDWDSSDEEAYREEKAR